MKSTTHYKKKDLSPSSTTWRSSDGVFSFRSDDSTGNIVGYRFKANGLATHTDGQFNPKKYGFKNSLGKTNYTSAKTGKILK